MLSFKSNTRLSDKTTQDSKRAMFFVKGFYFLHAYRLLDFGSIDLVVNGSAVHNEDEETQKKGTAAYEFKKVKSSTQCAL